jgi:hypothetical protein
MNRKKQPNNALTARLSGYSAAAGALIALASNANGQVAYSGIQNLTLDMPQELLDLDLDTNSIADFQFAIYGYGDNSVYNSFSYFINIGYAAMLSPRTDLYNNSWITKMSNIEIYSTSSGSLEINSPTVDGLNPGDIIDDAGGSWAGIQSFYWTGLLGVNYSQGFIGPDYSDISAWSAGDFINNEQYIGVRFYIGSDQHYGWIRASLGSVIDPLTIIDWAYELTPGEMIFAGEGLGINLPPSLRITGAKQYSNDSTTSLTLVASEEITDFDASDIQILNGTHQNFTETLAGYEFSVDISPDSEGIVIVEIQDSAFYNLSGDANLSTDKRWVFDQTAPELEIHGTLSGIDNQFSITINFNEKISGFDESDIDITNGTFISFQEISPGMEYEITIDYDEVNFGIDIPSGALSDLAGNDNEAASENWTIDITAPIITIDPGLTETSEINTNVEVTSNELIYGLNEYSFVISNGIVNRLTTNDLNLEYTIVVTAESAGQVIVDLPQGSVFDYYGNANEIASVSWLYQPVSINQSETEGVLIYPNPASALVSIRLKAEGSVKLFDLSGNELYFRENVMEDEIDVSSYVPGVYFIEIIDSENISRHKIIIE